MKKVFFFCGVILISSVFAEDRESCQTVLELYEVCKQSGILTSVKDIAIDKELYDQLILSDKELTSIKPNAFKNLTITTLGLGFADTTLNLTPDSFNGLPKLSELIIRSGLIPLEGDIFRAVKLIKRLSLVIDGAKHQILGKDIKLPNLKSLLIHDSNLSEISAETFSRHLPPVSNLTLLNNNIVSIHSNSFAPLRNLESLAIEMNDNLTNLQAGTFDALVQLQTLSLASNGLTHITRGIFNGLMNLQHLIFDDNKIEDIEFGCFPSHEIQELSLANNQLSVIETGAFHGLRVSRLDLSNNKIKKIENGAFKNSSIDELIIHGNINITVDKGSWGLSESTKVLTKAESIKV